MKVEVSSDEEELLTTNMTGIFDQAALLGLLRRLYSLGLSLISVIYIGKNEI